MHYRRLLPAIAVISLMSVPTAIADTITADTDREVCIASDNKTSSVVTFWDTLEDDVREQRLQELDQQDPGLKTAIEAYIAEDPDAATGAQLQMRLDAVDAGEGLAMLLPEETTDPEVVAAEAQQQFKTEYTYDEAVSTAEAISENPAANVYEQLEAAADESTRIAEIRAEVFSGRTEHYNQTQFELRNDFQACVDAIEDARPIPAQYLILGGAVILALGALALRAWTNSKRSSQHG